MSLRNPGRLTDRRIFCVASLQSENSFGAFAKPPFTGLNAVLAFFSRYTHVRMNHDGSKCLDATVWSGLVNALPFEDGL